MTTHLTAYGRLPRERGDPLEAYSRSMSFPASKANPIQWIPACAGKTEQDPLMTHVTAYGRLPRERGDPLEAYSRSMSFPASKSQSDSMDSRLRGKDGARSGSNFSNDPKAPEIVAEWFRWAWTVIIWRFGSQIGLQSADQLQRYRRTTHWTTYVCVHGAASCRENLRVVVPIYS